MQTFNIDVKGKGKILESSYIPAPNRTDQNWWLLKIQNGPGTFMLTVPTERSASVTKENYKRYAAGNVIYFKATPVNDRIIALAVHKIDSHLQGRLDLQ